MQTLIFIIIATLNGVVWACWRRIYGEGRVTGLAGNRAVQSLTAIALLLLWFVAKPQLWESWVFALLCSTWLVFQFWSRSVGEILDCGENKQQNKENYSRWFRIPLDFIYNKLGKVKYQGSYDWWYATCRYSLCMLPMMIISPLFIVPGISAAPIYWGSNALYKWRPQLMNSAGVWLDSPKNLAEIIHGFVFGGVIAAVGLL